MQKIEKKKNERCVRMRRNKIKGKRRNDRGTRRSRKSGRKGEHLSAKEVLKKQ